MNTEAPRILDLFCGCGGFSLGAARAGFRVVGAVDNDPHALAAHMTNFSKTKHLDLDLSQATGDILRGLLELGEQTIDGIIGGPPCQGFSCMGHCNGSDVRNTLFIQFYRLVSELNPLFFLAENVPNVLNRKYDSIRKSAFRKIGGDYTVLPPMRLCASDYGAPTNRTRVFFFGWRNDHALHLNVDSFLPPVDVAKICVRDALKGLPTFIHESWLEESQGWRKVNESANAAFGKRVKGLIPDGVGDKEAIRKLEKEKLVSGCLGTRHAPSVLDRFRSILPGGRDTISKSPRLDSDAFCPTLRAGTGSDRGSYQAVRPIHPTQDRVITPREAARLQGFPDWFQFDSTKWHSFRQIGNSISPILAEFVMTIIIQALMQKDTTGD